MELKENAKLIKETEILDLDAENGHRNLCYSTGLRNPQATALSALKTRHIRLFSDAVNDDRFDVNHSYRSDDGMLPRPLLAIALEQWTNPHEDNLYVDILLSIGARLDDLDEFTEDAPFHTIINKCDPDLVTLALKYVGRGSINVANGEGMTPLHCATAMLLDREEQHHQKIGDIVQVLLKTEGIEVNAEDLRGGQTPLFYAASAGNRRVVEILMEHGADSSLELDEQSIQSLIERKIKGFNVSAYKQKAKERPIKARLFLAAETNDVNLLVQLISNDPSIDWDQEDGSMTLLQLATSHGNKEMVKFLLEKGSNPNKATIPETRTPILIAAHHGYYDCLKVFKECPRADFSKVQLGTEKTVLHEVFLRDSPKHFYGRQPENASYDKCWQLLFPTHETNTKFATQINRIINYQEKLDGNTALHYATMQEDQDIIKMLLKQGANMGVKNHRGKTPVQCILPDTLAEFLSDECIERKGIITDEDFQITFKYDFLAPPILSEKMAKTYENSGKLNEDGYHGERPLPETEALWYLSTVSNDHRALLKHPVIASFLWLKWQRIRTIFYVNLFLYFLFVLLLTSFIFLRFGGFAVQPAFNVSDAQRHPSHDFNNSNKTAIVILTVAISVLLSILALREIFQMLVSVKRYFFSPENIMEIMILVISCIILYDEDAYTMDTKRHLAAVCILMTWTEMLVLIGRHPRLSTNITMFTTVITTFFAFLLWYSIIIIAFGISFYIMMHQDFKEGELNTEYPFFDTIWLALFKTSAMFVGELEFADIPFTGNVLSYLIFLAFIFLIVVVLMNLLNGLAVSDTGLIREEAEVVGWTSRVESITYVESMLLGDPFYFLSNWPPIKILQKIPNCTVCRLLYRFPRVRDLLQKISGGTKILLFYSCLPNKRAIFTPNKKTQRLLLSYKNSLKIDHETANGISMKTEGQKLAISDDVLDSAKSLLLAKMRAEKEAEEKKAIHDKLDRLEKIESMLEQLLAKK